MHRARPIARAVHTGTRGVIHRGGLSRRRAPAQLSTRLGAMSRKPAVDDLDAGSERARIAGWPSPVTTMASRTARTCGRAGSAGRTSAARWPLAGGRRKVCTPWSDRHRVPCRPRRVAGTPSGSRGRAPILDGVECPAGRRAARVHHRPVEVTVPRATGDTRSPGCGRGAVGSWERPWGRAFRGRARSWLRCARRSGRRPTGEAVLVLCLVVQQRLDAPAAAPRRVASGAVSRRRTVARAAPSATSATAPTRSGELDFAAAVPQGGLPAPSRQVVRRGRDGRVYLGRGMGGRRAGARDRRRGTTRWRCNPVDDALRQNEVTLGERDGAADPGAGATAHA